MLNITNQANANKTYNEISSHIYQNACTLSCFSHVQLFATHHTPLSIGFSKQEHSSGLPRPPPGDLLYPGIKSASLMHPALAGSFFTSSATWETHFMHSSVYMSIKTTVKYHFTLVRMASLKKSIKNNMLERVWRKGNPPTLLVGM